MTEKNKDCKNRLKNLEALSAVHVHQINILTSRVALLEMGMKALGQQKVMIVKQDKKEET